MSGVNRSEWTSPDTWRDPDCIECGGEGAPCCEPPDHPYPAPTEVRDRAIQVVGQALLASFHADSTAIVNALAAEGLLAAEPPRRKAVSEQARELDRLRAQRTAALARHTPDSRMGHDDVRCMSCPDESWPCLTFTALDGDASSR